MMVELGDVADIRSGYGFPKALQGRTSGDYPFAKVRDISTVVKGGGLVLDSADHWVDEADLPKLKARLLPAGSTLLAKIGEAIRLNRRVLAGRDLLVDNNVFAVIPVGIEQRFLLFFMKTLDLYPLAIATAVPSVRKSDLMKVAMPLAPLNEQRRIVDKIEALMARSRRAKESLDAIPPLLERFRQSVLAAAFRGDLTADWRAQNPDVEPIAEVISRVEVQQSKSGRAATKSVIEGRAAISVGLTDKAMPVGWRWTLLTDVARLESGHTPSRKHPEYWGGDVPWMGIADARQHHGEIVTKTMQMTNDLGLANSAARLLPKDTVCLSRTASVGYVTMTGAPMATSQDFVNWVCSDAVVPEFMMYALLAEGDHILRFGKGTTHTTIYYPEVKAFHVCLPPVEEQKEVVRRVRSYLDAIGRVGGAFEFAHDQAGEIDRAVLAKAFRGELVPQDPNDEPASVLLERIRAEHEADGPKTKRGARRTRAAKTS